MLLKAKLPLTARIAEKLYLDKPIHDSFECKQCGYNCDGHNDNDDDPIKTINLKLNELNKELNSKLKYYRIYFTYSKDKMKVDVYHFDKHYDYIPTELLELLE